MLQRLYKVSAYDIRVVLYINKTITDYFENIGFQKDLFYTLPLARTGQDRYATW